MKRSRPEGRLLSVIGAGGVKFKLIQVDDEAMRLQNIQSKKSFMSLRENADIHFDALD